MSYGLLFSIGILLLLFSYRKDIVVIYSYLLHQTIGIRHFRTVNSGAYCGGCCLCVIHHPAQSAD